jgi:hypothetical protein
MMPSPAGDFSLTFDFCEHRLAAHASDGDRVDAVSLEPMSVAEFHARFQQMLVRLNVPVRTWPVPVECADTTPFHADQHHKSYDRAHVERFHTVLRRVAHAFARHRGRFVGKCSPVHLFWGGFDLAVTRFSGRENPNPPTDHVMGAAYSHEVISHGFWPGGGWPSGGRVEEAVFYAYAVPEPSGFARAAVAPSSATYSDTFKEFFLPYDAVRAASDPEAMLLDFMETTYRAGAELGKWEIDGLRDRFSPSY